MSGAVVADTELVAVAPVMQELSRVGYRLSQRLVAEVLAVAGEDVAIG